jgi:hypothetical protein
VHGQTLIPLPFMYPLNPSSFHILTRPERMPVYCCFPPEPDWTCIKILSLSKGETAVREVAPARPTKARRGRKFLNKLRSRSMYRTPSTISSRVVPTLTRILKGRRRGGRSRLPPATKYSSICWKEGRCQQRYTFVM